MAFRNWVWFVAKLAVGLAVVGAIVFWNQFAPTSVRAISVTQADVVAEVMGTGTLEARVAASIGPKINGRIVEVMVDQGVRVQAGDLLVRLDNQELTQQVEIARANLAARKAAMDRLAADKQRTSAILTQSESDYQRQSKLAATKATSATELDKARESLSIAQAGLAQAEAAMAEAQEELVAAQRTLDYQQTLLANSRITAPFDGLIVARIREPGDVVVPGSSILTLISTNELWINAWVDETEMAKLSDGQPANTIFRSEPERPYKGRVARLGKQADRETREFVVDVTVLELPANWAVGQRADVFIEVARKTDTMSIPPAAITWRAGSPDDSTDRTAGVFLNHSGVARWTPIELGLRGRKAVAVDKGLTLDDEVIVPVDEGKKLVDGRRVSTE